MKRAVRNRLADLLLQAIEDPEKRAALAWLALFCDLAARSGRASVPLADLLAERRAAVPGTAEGVETTLAHLIGPGKLLRARRADTGGLHISGVPTRMEDIPCLVELEPDALAAFPLVCERARIYAGLIARMERSGMGRGLRDPLRKAMAGEMLGLDCDDFLPKVTAAREGIVTRGRARMRRMALAEIPRMAVRG